MYSDVLHFSVKLVVDTGFLRDSETMFTWKPIYAEIVDRLPQFREDTRKLADLMTSLHAKGLKVSGGQG
jgi:hypothetical protein